MKKQLVQDFSIHYSFPIIFEENIFNLKKTLIKEILCPPSQIKNLPVKVIVVIDSNVEKKHSSLISSIQNYFKKYSVLDLRTAPLIIAGGEESKKEFIHVESIYRAIEKYNICRHSYVIAIGGGSLIDMVGFAASTAHRGIKILRIPTTLLAQADAAIGVKNSINYLNKKNFIGSFATPEAVINDYQFLKTLDKNILIHGIAEAIKVALIKDKFFFEYIESHTQEIVDLNKKVIQKIIYQCAELHLSHIRSGDPFEKGSSRPLDFGHWSGHKLEQISKHSISHGQGVALGICLDCVYANMQGYLDQKTLFRIINLFHKLGFLIYSPFFEHHLSISASKKELQLDQENVLHGLEEFREHLGGALTILLLKDIANTIEINQVDYEVMKKSIYKLKKINTDYKLF